MPWFPWFYVFQQALVFGAKREKRTNTLFHNMLQRAKAHCYSTVAHYLFFFIFLFSLHRAYCAILQIPWTKRYLFSVCGFVWEWNSIQNWASKSCTYFRIWMHSLNLHQSIRAVDIITRPGNPENIKYTTNISAANS